MLRKAFLPLAFVVALGCDDAKQTEPTAEPATPRPAESPAPTAEVTPPPTDEEPSEEASGDDPEMAAETPDDPKPATRGAKKGGNEKTAGKGAFPSEPAKPTKGAVVKDAPFVVWLQGAGRYEVGKPGAVTAVLEARPPYKCNDKYPYKFKLDPAPAGVTFANAVVKGMSIAPKQSTMSIPFTPSETGTKTISGQLSFSVCTDAKCLIEKRKLSVSVNVE